MVWGAGSTASNSIDFKKSRILDLFGGTGAHSIEAASRGSHDISYVEKHGACFRYVSKIIQEWNIADRIICYKMDCKRFIGHTELKYDYIFADPPYQQLEWIHLPDMIKQHGLLEEDGLLVIEHSHLLDFSAQCKECLLDLCLFQLILLLSLCVCLSCFLLAGFLIHIFLLL